MKLLSVEKIVILYNSPPFLSSQNKHNSFLLYMAPLPRSICGDNKEWGSFIDTYCIFIILGFKAMELQIWSNNLNLGQANLLIEPYDYFQGSFDLPLLNKILSNKWHAPMHCHLPIQTTDSVPHKKHKNIITIEMSAMKFIPYFLKDNKSIPIP